MKNIKHKAYRFSLKPTDEQKVLLSKHFGCTRFIYNKILEEKQKHYLNNAETLNYHKCCEVIKTLKNNQEFIWLKEINSQSLQQASKDLETAYGSFFKGNSKFPKFKKKGIKDSFRVPQHVRVEGNKLIIPKFKGGIQVQLHRKINGKIKSATISKTPSGKYFVSILCEEEIEHKVKTNREVGIDLGLTHFAITDKGEKFKNPKYLKREEEALKKAQKDLSRKDKGSNRYIKQRLKVARIHEKITNSRKDYLHKLSTQLVDTYDFIAMEDLSVKKMMKGKGNAKHIQDASWRSFVNMVEYKSDWYGKVFVKIDKYYPSTMTCSSCDFINRSLTLKDRQWKCPKCSIEHDRDINAAKNIYRAGRSITGVEKKALVNFDETIFYETFKKKAV